MDAAGADASAALVTGRERIGAMPSPPGDPGCTSAGNTQPANRTFDRRDLSFFASRREQRQGQFSIISGARLPRRSASKCADGRESWRTNRVRTRRKVCTRLRPIQAVHRSQPVARTWRQYQGVWWSQAGSNRRPLQCHCVTSVCKSTRCVCAGKTKTRILTGSCAFH